MVRVEVDTSRCQGHTLCAMIAPDVFELDDTDGHANVPVDVVGAEYHEQVHEAVRSCPEQAIHILPLETAQ